MSDFSTKKINNEVVKAVPLLAEKDNRPVKGAALFPEIYANVFLCARKKSGKTSCIYKILQKCCGPKTRIVAFCATLHKDPSWETIQTWAEHKGLPFIGHTSIIDEETKTDLLKELIQGLEQRDEPEEKKVKSILDDDSDSEEEPERPAKYQYPEYIFILDDLSDELKRPSVTTFLKKNRHFRAKILVSSQYLNDLNPMARKQLDYYILFGGNSEDKIEEVRKGAGMSISPARFWQLYKFATSDQFSFLYYDWADKSFRRNFNTLIDVPEE